MNASRLLQNRDYPVLTNYRDVPGGAPGRVGPSNGQLQTVFPAAKPGELQLV